VITPTYKICYSCKPNFRLFYWYRLARLHEACTSTRQRCNMFFRWAAPIKASRKNNTTFHRSLRNNEIILNAV